MSERSTAAAGHPPTDVTPRERAGCEQPAERTEVRAKAPPDGDRAELLQPDRLPQTRQERTLEQAALEQEPPDRETPTAPAVATEHAIAKRFRGFLPVVIDVETGGFNSATDALLEVASVMLHMNADGDLELGESQRYLVKPFPGGRLDPASLQVTGIDPFHPLRPALDEGEALRRLFHVVRKEVRQQSCNRAVLVGHNSFFDLQFINAAVERAKIKRNPFHPFSSFDTVSLAGVCFGQTVLSRAVVAAGLEWQEERAHSALYDAEMTAKLFCEIVNRFRAVFGS